MNNSDNFGGINDFNNLTDEETQKLAQFKVFNYLNQF